MMRKKLCKNDELIKKVKALNSTVLSMNNLFTNIFNDISEYAELGVERYKEKRPYLNDYSISDVHLNVADSKFRFIEMLIEAVIDIQSTDQNPKELLFSLELAKDILREFSSLDRGYLLMRFFKAMERDDWCKLFIDTWVGVETSDYMMEQLEEVFSKVDISYLQQFMSDENKAEWEKLDDLPLVYRGEKEYDQLSVGYSWSIDKGIAERFASMKGDTMNIYRLFSSTLSENIRLEIQNKDQEISQTFILYGKADKRKSIVFFERGEMEIFSPCVMLINAKIFDSCAYNKERDLKNRLD